MLRYTSKTHELVTVKHEERQGNGFRRHLGASVIGRTCARQLWYIFRWATRTRFSGRMLRLFERGEREEAYIAALLRKSGVHVLEADPETGEQFRCEDHGGHFGGSMDLKLFDTPDFAGEWILGECKTHSDKSFKKLKKEGLRRAKWEHVVQMQLYMHYAGLPAALYIAANKNDDSLFMPVVEYDEAVAAQYIDRAGKVIFSRTPPERIPNASVGFFECKFCDHKAVCLENGKKEVNCRTCVHSSPIDGGWWCEKYQCPLEEYQQRRGCESHTEIPE